MEFIINSLLNAIMDHLSNILEVHTFFIDGFVVLFKIMKILFLSLFTYTYARTVHF